MTRDLTKELSEEATKVWKGIKRIAYELRHITDLDRHAEIVRKENALLALIKTIHVKDNSETLLFLYECEKKNFDRLSERFKHDKVKTTTIESDWIDYIGIITSVIIPVGKTSISRSENVEVDNVMIRRDEIEKRFKNLLQEEYISPYK